MGTPAPPAAPPPGVPGAVTRGLTLHPKVTVAPVGAEVVLVAGVGGAASLLAGHRLEWMLDAKGVGEFVAVSDQNAGGILLGADNRPRKINNSYAIGRTSARAYTLTRGTPDRRDDVPIQAGQAWITVTSAVEGTSYITAFAPQVGQWNQRRAGARIYWVDAQWVFPSAGSGTAGARQILTTRLTRMTDGTPIHGWRVRYAIVGGSPAGFMPNGAQAVDATSDQQGNASVEIFQKEARGGTTQIDVQVIRPPLPGQTDARPLLLARAQTTATWGDSDIAVKLTGPAQASPGSTATYRIDVTNPGTVPNRATEVRVELPAGLDFVDANPTPVVNDRLLLWNLGEVPAGQTRSVITRARVGAQGPLKVCARGRTGSGLTAEDCVDTAVVLPRVDVKINGPAQAQAGTNVRFEVIVTNQGNVPATKLLITDSFDAGLKHMVSASPIERDLGTLAPGSATRVPINFQILRVGQWCHHVVITGQGGLRATADACVTATAPAPKEEAQPAMEVTKTGPRRRKMGEMADFVIRVKNTGNVALTNVRVADRYERALIPTATSPGRVIHQDEIRWTFPRIEPGQMQSVRVRCRCVQVTEKTCNRVIVTSDSHGPIMAEACLEIVPTASGQPPLTAPENGARPTATPAHLEMTVADLDDPVRIGQRVAYQIQVKNTGAGSDYAGKLTVTFPEALVPALVGTRLPAHYRLEGQSIHFDALAEIRAGETVSFLIPFRVGKAGTIRVIAHLESRGLAKPITVEETTDVLPP